MWRFELSQDDKHSGFISMCVNATKEAPEYLSHRHTNDAIDTIARASGSSKRIFKTIIITVIPDGCVLKFTEPEKETHSLEDAKKFILLIYNDDEKKLITDMRKFNCRDFFGGYCIHITELENGSGAHHHRKSETDTDTTTNALFVPGLRLIPHIFQANIDLL